MRSQFYFSRNRLWLVAAALVIGAIQACSPVYPVQYLRDSTGLGFQVEADDVSYRVLDLSVNVAKDANRAWPYTPEPYPATVDPGSLGTSHSTSMSIAPQILSSLPAFSSRIRVLSQQIELPLGTVRGAPPFREAQPYRIMPGDIVNIVPPTSPAGQTTTTQSSVVDAKGDVYFLKFGGFSVKGMSIREAQKQLDKQAQKLVLSSEILNVGAYNSQWATLIFPSGIRIVAITNIPQTLRRLLLSALEGMNPDERGRTIIFQRDGKSYSMSASDVLDQKYGYRIYIEADDRITLLDPTIENLATGQPLRDSDFEFMSRRTELAIIREENERGKQELILRQRDDARLQRTEEREEVTLDFLGRDQRRADAADRRAQAEEERSSERMQFTRAIERRAQAAETRAQAAELRAQAEAAYLEVEELRARNREARDAEGFGFVRAAEQRARAEEERAKEIERRAVERMQFARTAEERAQASEEREQAFELREQAQAAYLQAEELRAQNREAREAENFKLMQTAEARARAAEIRAQAAEARAESEERRDIEGFAYLKATERRAEATERRAEATERREQTQFEERSLEREIASIRDQNELIHERIIAGEYPRNRAFIMGEVREPTLVNFPFDRQLTLASMLVSAEGLVPETSDPRAIYIIRSPAGASSRYPETVVFRYDSSDLAQTVASVVFEMRPNDLVYVLPRKVTNWNRFISQILPSLSSVITTATTL